MAEIPPKARRTIFWLKRFRPPVLMLLLAGEEPTAPLTRDDSLTGRGL